MNFKFNLSGIEVSAVGVDVKVGDLSYEVTDLKPLESLQVAKAIPGILREIKEIFDEEPIEFHEEIHVVPVPSGIFGGLFNRHPKAETGEGCDENNEEDFEFDEDPIVNSVSDKEQAQTFTDKVVKRAENQEESKIRQGARI
jgi:hypothetical protein